MWERLQVLNQCRNTGVLSVLSLTLSHFAAVAMRLLHLSPAEISPNLWYLAPNPASRAFSTAYPYLMGLMFLASFPFTILARTISTSAVALLCCPQPTAGEGAQCYCLLGVLSPLLVWTGKAEAQLCLQNPQA